MAAWSVVPAGGGQTLFQGWDLLARVILFCAVVCFGSLWLNQSVSCDVDALDGFRVVLGGIYISKFQPYFHPLGGLFSRKPLEERMTPPFIADILL